jgi:hypothetical protein
MKANPIWLFCTLAFTVLVGPSPVGSPPFSLTIESAQRMLHTGSQIELKLTLTNTSPHEFTIRDTNRWCDYEVEVRDSRGQLASETAYKRSLKCGFQVTAGRKIIRTLKPGESYEDALFVNQLYDLTRPGAYFILVSRDIPKELGAGKVESNTATLSITN